MKLLFAILTVFSLMLVIHFAILSSYESISSIRYRNGKNKFDEKITFPPKSRIACELCPILNRDFFREKI